MVIFFFFFNDTATTEIYTPFPTRRSSDLSLYKVGGFYFVLDGHHRVSVASYHGVEWIDAEVTEFGTGGRSEEHTSELQSRQYLVCRLLLEKKNKQYSCIKCKSQ